MIEISNLRSGQMLEPSSHVDRMPVINPATAETIGTVPVGTVEDVDLAVLAAQEAFPIWSGLPASERAACLYRLADLVDANVHELARLETDDNGKPLALARDLEIPRAASNLRFFAGAILHTRSEAYDLGGMGLSYSLHRPRGVAACISPWNLPLYLFTWKIAPALATGEHRGRQAERGHAT